MRQNKYEYDAFISHAVEDKIPIANELCAKLERAGLKIWYSGKELGIGDSIEKTIERGLNRSRYGIVIFSPTYLAKNWTIREFYTLLAKEIEEQKVILPVLYNITLDELRNKDMVMADRFAVNSDKGMDFVVDRLVREIRKKPVIKQRMAWLSRIWVGLALSVLANILFLCKETVLDSPARPSVYAGSQAAGLSDQPRGLLREVRNAVAGMQGCRCHHPSSDEQPILVKAGFSPPAESLRAPTPARSEPSDEGNRHPGDRRVTMAVVFQIETSAATADAWEADMEEIFHTLDPQQKRDQLETISGHETMASARCTRASHLRN